MKTDIHIIAYNSAILTNDFNNDLERFAITGKTLLPGKLAPCIVGHVPHELPKYIWHALQYSAIITAEVNDECLKRLPLVQGGLETLIEMSIVWHDAVKIKKRKEKPEIVQIGDYREQCNKNRNEGWCRWKDCFFYSFVLWWNNSNFLKKSLRHWNTGLVYSRASVTSWGEGASLTLVGDPSSDGVTIRMPYEVDVLHRPALHPVFSYWIG